MVFLNMHQVLLMIFERNQKMDEKPLPKWINKFFAIIYRHWSHHGPCEHINLQAYFDEQKDIWQINAAPVYQEVYGGDEDGKQVWTGFIFDTSNFGRENGVWIQDTAIVSFCDQCNPNPKIIIQGKFRGHQFNLDINLEPVAETTSVEVIDTIQQKIREIPDNESENG